jgi:hypothetical protein
MAHSHLRLTLLASSAVLLGSAPVLHAGADGPVFQGVDDENAT